ncbi:MAG: HEPN domain-containing protein [Bacteroidetes bacterium]|nr:MAG: HEPN domain-containing protein [Bacteroidota bacterium]
MTEAEKIRVLAAYRMEQATDALQAARTLIDAGLPRDAVNRAYYAIFYGVLALLVTRRLGTSKHSGALTLFSREFVKKGLLPPEMARLARRAFDRRLEADYAELVTFSLDEAEDTLIQAQAFVERVRILLPEVLPE